MTALNGCSVMGKASMVTSDIPSKSCAQCRTEADQMESSSVVCGGVRRAVIRPVGRWCLTLPLAHRTRLIGRGKNPVETLRVMREADA